MVVTASLGRSLSPRGLQLVFGVFALTAGTLIALRQDVHHPLFQAAGTAGYALAAMLSFASWLALDRASLAARARRVLIVFHLLFIPAQFLFLLAHQMPWLGMLLSTVITVRLKPRFPRLGRVSRKAWLTLHIGIGVGWLGVSLAMLALSVVGVTAQSPERRHAAYLFMDTFDLALAIPSVFLTIITGVVVSLGTPWGLVKHRWVLIKLIIALSLPVLATFEGSWIETLTERTQDPAAEPGGTGVLLVGAMGLFFALLWTAVILSVFKPGGRTRWGRGEGTRRARRRASSPWQSSSPVAGSALAPDLPATTRRQVHP